LFKIRNAVKSDMLDILEIENNSFTKPWNEKAFLCEFSKTAAGINIFYAADDGETGLVAGYAVGNIIIDFVHILNIAVAEKFRGRGLGLELLKSVEREAFKRKLFSLTLEVREKNYPAVNLYKKSGYEVKGRREKSYGGVEDELLMWKTL
jgi:[ribosomal protein S18]-alanine N-acetyltransferase